MTLSPVEAEVLARLASTREPVALSGLDPVVFASLEGRGLVCSPRTTRSLPWVELTDAGRVVVELQKENEALREFARTLLQIASTDPTQPSPSAPVAVHGPAGERYAGEGS